MSAIPKPFRLGVSFHSFTEEYCSLKWSFEDMMELACHLGRGVEIVGPAHHRGFPDVTLEFARSFRSAVERFDLIPVSYGSYADPFMLPDRDLTDDELVEYTLPQLESAARLGFSVVRLQFFAARVIGRLLPAAERLGLKLGYELHAPLTLEADDTKRLVEQIEKLDSPHLGLIPDCGIFGRSVPQFRLDHALTRGVPPAVVSRAVALWQAQVPLDDALRELAALGLAAADVDTIESFWGSLGQSDPTLLGAIMHRVILVHGKYFSIVDGDEPDLRYRDIVAALVQGGYRGWMSSEYEGPGGISSFELVRQHQAMVQRYMNEAMAVDATAPTAR